MPQDGTSRGKQTWRCGDCKHRYTPEGNRPHYSEAVKIQAVSMYPAGSRHAAIGPAPAARGLDLGAPTRVENIDVSKLRDWPGRRPAIRPSCNDVKDERMARFRGSGWQGPACPLTNPGRSRRKLPGTPANFPKKETGHPERMAGFFLAVWPAGCRRRVSCPRERQPDPRRQCAR